jgi:hypothetical protein
MLALVGVGFTAQAQRRAYRLTDRQVDNLIRRIETRSDRFRASLDAALDRSRLDGTRYEDDINAFVRDYEQATDSLRSRFNARTSVAADVQSVLTRAAAIDGFMTRNRLSVRAQNDWALLRTDLNELATAYGVNWNWSAQTTTPTYGSQQPSYNANDRQLDRIIRRIENNADRFRASLTNALNTSRMDGTRREDRINDLVRDFETATDNLRNRFNTRAAAAADVQNVLDRAVPINNFMSRRPLTTQAQNDWATLRTDLDALASAYGVAWNWNNRATPTYGNTYPTPGGGVYGTDASLTGTFRLNPSRSDNARDVADRATRNLPYADRQRIHDAIVARLESPEMIAIERRGMNVTIASSRAPQTTFTADGRERTEQLPNGITARVSATLTGDQLMVSSQGYRENDFSVTFAPIDGGRSLQVTRRIFSERLNQPVVVQNTYDRTADVALWNNVYNGTVGHPTGTVATTGDFIIRDGETLIATLNNDVSTKTAREGDRFTMTVRSPAEFEGAVIDGTVRSVERGGRITGRSGMTLDFENIRLRDGRSFRFEGFVDSVRTMGGETVRIDNEGSVQNDDSRGTTTAQRAAIGTAVGAIIGAIAGGGKGAAIGAIIGAAGGAGSVYVQGRDDLELLTGSEVTVRASAPNR